jgi:predicted P-loop ATPase
MKHTNEILESFLTENYSFQYNQINNRLFYKPKLDLEYSEVKDFDINSILREIKSVGFSKVKKIELLEILNSNYTKTYNPFQCYFNSLTKWKLGDTDYIKQLANTVLVADQEQDNWNKWFKKWIVASVGCAIVDDVVNQTNLIFSGAQGVGKTTWLMKLVPKSLKDFYYSGSINLNNKDSEIMLAENFLICLDELGSMSKRNISAFKEIITKPKVKLRRPYAVCPEMMPRRASFVSTINTKEFLLDHTGNRRYLPFEAIQIDNNHLIDLDNVYAQALYLFENGFQYWFDDNEIKEVAQHNMNYTEISVEKEILESIFEPCIGIDKPDFELETENLLEHIYAKSNFAKRLSAKSLGQALNKMNWPKRKTMGRRYWLLNEIKQ